MKPIDDKSKEESKWGRNLIKRSFKPRIQKGSMTQSFFPSKKNSFDTKDMKKQKASFGEFYQTFASDLSGQWVRPESKRNSRKQGINSRPETSKGTRNYNRKQKKQLKQLNRNPLLTSKSMHDNLKEQKQNQLNDNNFESIRIIINNSSSKRNIQKSTHHEKLNTELPNDFLSLFAD